MGDILVYGATGYTGKLIAEEAKAKGVEIILGGRDAAKLAAESRRLGFEARAAALDDRSALRSALRGVKAVLHVAGPFSATWRPMVEACLDVRAHYLDITGELGVIEGLARRANEAGSAGIVVMPAVGFDVVPTDCLLAHVAGRLPDANALRLFIKMPGTNMSRGTAKTALEGFSGPLYVRRNGALVGLPQGSLAREADFGAGPEACLAIGWGDVASAYYTTGIGNFETYFAASPEFRRMTQISRWFGPLLALAPVQRFLKSRIDRMPEGPDRERLKSLRVALIAEAENSAGRIIASRLSTPEGYLITAAIALETARRLAAGGVAPGFATAAKAFGADYILEFPDVTRVDLP